MEFLGRRRSEPRQTPHGQAGNRMGTGGHAGGPRLAGLRLRIAAVGRYKDVDRATTIIWRIVLVAERAFHRQPGSRQRRSPPTLTRLLT